MSISFSNDSNVNRTGKFERIFGITNGVLERIWKNSKKRETLRKNPKESERTNLEKKRNNLEESEGIQENLSEYETKNWKDLERIRGNLHECR